MDFCADGIDRQASPEYNSYVAVCVTEVSAAERMGILMKGYAALGLIAVLLLWVSTCAVADLVTVNGDDSDWTDPDETHDDVNGDVVDPGPPIVYVPGYDIDYSYYLWDYEAVRSAFMLQTIDPSPQTGDFSADLIEILINWDDSSATGGNWHGMQGADYRVLWDYDGTAGTAYNPTSGSNPVYWQQWTGAPDWSTVGGVDADDVVIAWANEGTDYSVIECTIDPTLFNFPDEFTWGFYLDNGSNASDDASPNHMHQRGYTPEPTTLVLLPLGLAGLAAWRRCREG